MFCRQCGPQFPLSGSRCIFMTPLERLWLTWSWPLSSGCGPLTQRSGALADVHSLQERLAISVQSDWLAAWKRSGFVLEPMLTRLRRLSTWFDHIYLDSSDPARDWVLGRYRYGGRGHHRRFARYSTGLSDGGRRHVNCPEEEIF